MKVLVVLLTLAGGADAVTTTQNLHMGGHETVIALHPQNAMAASSMIVAQSVVVGLLARSALRHGHPHIANVFMGVGIAGHATGAIANVAQR